MSAATIMIVEPDVSIANELKDILEGLDYKVVAVVSSGAQTIKMIKQLRPAIVLLNIRLRGRSDGIETGSLIRVEHEVPVVYMVDQESRAHIRRAGVTGSFGYIFRPFDDEQIYATVETVAVVNELWARQIVPEGTAPACFSANPAICDLADQAFDYGSPADVFGITLIPQLLTTLVVLLLGWRFTRPRDGSKAA